MAADFDPLVFFLQHSPNLERLFLELKLVCISRHPMNICWCGFCYVPLIKLLFCEKYDDPEEEMEDRTRLVGRSFVCTHLKMVKILFWVWNKSPFVGGVVQGKWRTCWENIRPSADHLWVLYSLLLLSVRHFHCQSVLLLTYVTWECYSAYFWSSFCILGVNELMFSYIYTRPLHRTMVAWSIEARWR
jgi:hypothetical protein